MTVEGPAGRELLLLDDDKKIITLLALAKGAPPRSMQVDIESQMNIKINQELIDGGFDISITEDTVNLAVQDHPVDEEKKELLDAPGALSAQQYEVQADFDGITQGIINAVHNEIVDEVTRLGFNILGAETKVV